MKCLVAALMVAGGATHAVAQQKSDSEATIVPTAKSGTLKQLLVDGYEIKTGFSDNTGGAYVVLQKATSAFMCHSGVNQLCEKLN
jgi:hypothetical protein